MGLIGSRRNQIDKLGAYLDLVNQKGDLLISVLIDDRGEVIASSTEPSHVPDMEPEVAAQLQSFVVRAACSLGLDRVREVTIEDVLGQRLICRPIDLDGQTITLAVLTSSQKRCRRWLNRIDQVACAVLAGCDDDPDKFCQEDSEAEWRRGRAASGRVCAKD
jgi:Tfp pilus assembly protein PilN